VSPKKGLNWSIWSKKVSESRIVKEQDKSVQYRHQGHCQVGITSSPPALMMLCIVAIAVTNFSRLFRYWQVLLKPFWVSGRTGLS